MWTIIIMYLLLIPCAALFIYTKHKDKEMLSIVFKALSTGIILLTGIYGMCGPAGNAGFYAIFIIIGLALGLAGDVAICKNFLLGMLFFGLGHFSYIAGISRVTGHVLWSVPAFIVLGVLIFTLYKKSKINLGNLMVPTIIYCLIIMAMVSLAATAPFSILLGGAVLFIGAVLFAASDTMLALNKFHDDFNRGLVNVDRFNCRKDKNNGFNRKLDIVSLSCYFMGQSLFAVSIFYMY